MGEAQSVEPQNGALIEEQATRGSGLGTFGLLFTAWTASKETDTIREGTLELKELKPE